MLIKDLLKIFANLCFSDNERFCWINVILWLYSEPFSVTARKASKHGVFSGPYFRIFGLNAEVYSVNLCIQSEYKKIRTRKNSVFGHFSRSVWKQSLQSFQKFSFFILPSAKIQLLRKFFFACLFSFRTRFCCLLHAFRSSCFPLLFALFLSLDLVMISFLIREVMWDLLFPRTIRFLNGATVFKIFVIINFRDQYLQPLI